MPAASVGFFQKTCLDLAGNAIDTADGRDQPQLIADPHQTVFTAINLYFTIGHLLGQRWRTPADIDTRPDR